jgi:hypothetical protein
MGQHLFLNIIPSNFTAGTGGKVWCVIGLEKTYPSYIVHFGAFAAEGARNFFFSFEVRFIHDTNQLMTLVLLQLRFCGVSGS